MLAKIVATCIVMLSPSMSDTQGSSKSRLDAIAESYVKLVLDVGLYDEGYVDFYYGPEEWQPEPLDSSAAADFPYEDLKMRASELIKELDLWSGSEFGELERARWSFLRAHAVSVAARIDMLGGETLSFNEESKALFDAVAPSFEIDDFESVVAKLDSLVPGSGNLKERLATYRKMFVIPADRVELVMQTALDSARSRTKAHMDLPDGDSFSLEIVTDKPWRAFNAFKGNATSLIQLNVDSPVRIGTAFDCACHEGYPGHHVHASLWEKELYRGRGWVEFSISPLYSPSSLVAEGIAECAVDMVFPGDEAVRFEKSVLYPLAGLDTAEAERYWQISGLIDSLKWVIMTAAQKHLDGELSKEEAIRWLTDYALMPPGVAEQTIPALEIYRSYVITYQLGKIMVRDWMKTKVGPSGDTERRWEIFTELMSTPKIPSQL